MFCRKSCATYQVSLSDQWHYVNTAKNSGDLASRGLDVNQKNKVERWFQGPAFLWQNKDTWYAIETTPELNMDDPEVKKQVIVNAVADQLERSIAIKDFKSNNRLGQ